MYGAQSGTVAITADRTGREAFRATQIMKWLHHRSVDDFEAMTDISKQLRAYLVKHAEIAEPPVISEKVSKDGTIKWLLEARSGSAIETVFIPEAVAAPCACHPKSVRARLHVLLHRKAGF